MSYEYNKPRRINAVSVFLTLLAIGAGYAGYKFVPVYWQARKVDEALNELKLPASDFRIRSDEVVTKEAEKIIARTVARLHEMGIEDQPDQPVQVWFTPEYEELHAKYKVIVTHPAVLKPTAIVFDRGVPIPKN